MKEKAIQHQSLKGYGFVMKSIYEVCETVTDYVAAGSFADLKKNVEYLSEPNYAQLIRTVDLKSGFLKGNFVYVNKKAFDYLWRVNLNCESIILPNIGNCGEVYYVVPEKLPYKNNVLATNAILVRSLKESNKYLFYTFQSKHFQDELKRITSPVGQTKFNKTELKNIYIPIPSRKVQEEIVKILDSFTNLIDALNEELSLRQKQFEYYREKLLTFDESNYVKISSICKRIVSGGTPKTTIDRYYQGNIPWLRTEEVDFCYVYETKKHITEEAIANSSTKMIPVNCVIIAMYGATAAKCCINKIPLCTNQACCNLEIDDTLALYKFVFYNICKEYEKLKSLGEGSQNNISGQKIKDYRIPIPSLSIQQSIVEKLDAFESLISSLKEEIALRQKQYEYYREKLLTFD